MSLPPDEAGRLARVGVTNQDLRRLRLVRILTAFLLLLASTVAPHDSGPLAWVARSLPPGIAYAATISVNSTADVIANDGQCTLREAIIAANTDTASGAGSGECPAGSGADLMVLPEGTYTLTIAGTGENAAASGDLDIMANLTISGAGAPSTIIQACDMAANSACLGRDRVFHIVEAVTVNLSDLTIRKGNTTTDGGGIRNEGALTLTNVTLSHSRAGTDGGGIVNRGGSTLTLTNVTLSQNTSANDGAGLYNFGGTATVTGSTFIQNSAGGDGGAIGQIGSSGLTITNSTIANNSATGSVSDGGGIYVSLGTVAISGSSISGNSAVSSGGGVHNIGTSVLTVTNTTVSGNSAQNGGGIYNNNVANLTGVTISGNFANDIYTNFGGGGIRNSGTLTVTNSTISGNIAVTDGGGLLHLNSRFGAGDNVLSLANVTIGNNTADFDADGAGNGGGIRRAVTGSNLHTAQMKNTSITGNSAGSANQKHPDCSGALVSQGYNLLGDSIGCTGLTNGVNGDQVGTSAAPVNANLGPLADNGGPTQTHALQPGSPAVDAGNPDGCTDASGAALTTDQRGMSRTVDGNNDGTARCDIGALELQPIIPRAYIPVLLRNYAGGW